MPLGAFDIGVDSAGIVHDVVGDELRPDRTVARCGRILDREAPFHPFVHRRRRAAEGMSEAEIRAGTPAGDFPTPRAMCPHCARWRAGHEAAIVWSVDPSDLDYVRVWEVWSARRHGAPRWRFKSFELLGWADLGPGARTFGGRFVRRVFYLKPHDRRPGNPGEYYRVGAPCEAVDPRTLAPNRPGFKTSRAWGREL